MNLRPRPPSLLAAILSTVDSILVTTVAGLFTRGRGNHAAAYLALILGLVITPIAKYAFQLSAPFLLTLVIASLA